MPGRILCFGESLLRLSAPGSELLLQSANLDARFGGAEANVAVSLARLGHEAALLTVLPDNAIGQAAADQMRGMGVDLSRALRRAGRMGLYFLTPGATLRPSEVLYDRKGSAFADHADALDLGVALAGADWLHLSGVTPAVGAKAADAAVRAVKTAIEAGVRVSFDGNFRGKMWAEWGGDPGQVLRELMSGAELLFGDERDVGLALGLSFDRPDPWHRRADAAEAAFKAFPRLQRMAGTLRVEHGGRDCGIAAALHTRSGEVRTPQLELKGVVDRIGSGDALVAGLLHGVIQGWDDARSLDFALAASALKHSIPGDFSPAREADILATMDDPRLHVRR